MSEGNRDGELDITEQMLLTLDLKKSMKLWHCSSVASVEEDGCGFRRRFMVEKSSLELPGFLLIKLEYNCERASLRELEPTVTYATPEGGD